MPKALANYSRPFVELATVWWEKYKTDFFFRTTVNIIVLQAGLVLISIGAFWWAIQYSNHQVSNVVESGIQTLIRSYPNYPPERILESISGVQWRSVWYVFGGITLISILFGILLARFTLRPARDTLHYQKLFISNIAHELRTPLSTIKTSTEVALLDERLSAPLRKNFGDIVGELDRISEIINNLLSLNTLTRPERMEFQNVDLGPVVDTVVKRHTLFAHERGIEMVMKKDNYRTVWGNPAALEQVMTNLVKNALSYTPRNSNGMVVIALHPDYHGSVVFSVTDNGIGISQEDLFHIFEPFYRADTSRVRNIKKSGSGLGLTIVNEIVRVHHGRINIQSARRKGTSISVYLPAGISADASALGEEHKKEHSEVSFDFSKGFDAHHPPLDSAQTPL